MDKKTLGRLVAANREKRFAHIDVTISGQRGMLAKRAKCAEATISFLERGRPVMFSEDLLKSICKTLNIPFSSVEAKLKRHNAWAKAEIAKKARAAKRKPAKTA